MTNSARPGATSTEIGAGRPGSQKRWRLTGARCAAGCLALFLCRGQPQRRSNAFLIARRIHQSEHGSAAETLAGRRRSIRLLTAAWGRCFYAGDFAGCQAPKPEGGNQPLPRSSVGVILARTSETSTLLSDFGVGPLIAAPSSREPVLPARPKAGTWRTAPPHQETTDAGTRRAPTAAHIPCWPYSITLMRSAPALRRGMTPSTVRPKGGRGGLCAGGQICFATQGATRPFANPGQRSGAGPAISLRLTHGQATRGWLRMTATGKDT